MGNKRNIFIDFLKCVAIILVVFGHCIQFGAGESYQDKAFFYNNVVFKIIYSFHMPLFMLISGYLAYKGIKKRTFKENLIKQIKTLMIPVVIWSFHVIIKRTLEFDNGGFMGYARILVGSIIYNLWFLWAIFLCNIVVSICDRIKNKQIMVLIYLLGFAITFVLPDNFNITLYKFMYPYFLLGYYYNNIELKLKNKISIVKYNILTFVISGIMFITMLFFFNYDCYIYTSKYSLITSEFTWYKQFGIDMFRFGIGILGSITVISLLRLIFRPMSKVNWIVKSSSFIGKRTIGIYIVSGIIQSYLFPIFFKDVSLNYFLIITQTVVTTLASLLISYIIEKNKYTNLLLLGGR